MPVLAPATRVASRKLGPDPREARRGRERGLGHQHVGQHVRQVADRGQQAVVGGRVDGRSGVAPSARPAGAGARRAARTSARGGRQVPERALEQVRRARARRPPSPRPAIGWPPTKRSSSIASTSVRLVEPTSVTTQSGRRRRQRVAHLAGQRAHRARSRSRHRRRPGPPPASRRRCRWRRARRARSQPLGRAAEARHLDVVQLLARRQADRAADQARRPGRRSASGRRRGLAPRRTAPPARRAPRPWCPSPCRRR